MVGGLPRCPCPDKNEGALLVFRGSRLCTSLRAPALKPQSHRPLTALDLNLEMPMLHTS